MTRSHHHEKRRLAHHGDRRETASQPMPDGAVYIAFALVGAFVILLVWATHIMPWRPVTVGYIIAIAVLINYYAWRAYAGQQLAPWQRAMARVPLRFAGFGPKAGRPFSAAKGDDRVRLMLMVSLAASSIVIAAVSLLLIR